MTIDATKDPATRTGAFRRIGEQLGVNPEALRTWVSRAKIAEGLRPAMTADSDRITGLERVVRELRRATASTEPARSHKELHRQDVPVVRCTVERLMRQKGLRRISRAKWPRTTKPASETGRPSDLFKRRSSADAPKRLRVAGITYVRTFAGRVCAAFVLDVFSRRIVGWQVSTTSLYGAGPGRSGNGYLVPQEGGCRPYRAGAAARPRRPALCDPLHPAPQGSRPPAKARSLTS